MVVAVLLWVAAGLSHGLPVDRVVIGHNVGHSADAPALRDIGRSIPRIGYEAWARKTYLPLIDLGYRRFELHNPFGIDPDPGPSGAMSFDAAAELDWSWWRVVRDQPGVARLSSRSLVAALRAVEAARPDVEIEWILYLGSITTDDDLVGLRDDPAAWLYRAYYAVKPALDLGATIGFDASSGVREGSREHRFIQLVEAMGSRVIVEAWPHRDATHLHHFDVLTVWGRSWRTLHTHPDSPGELLTGERLVLLGHPGGIEGAKRAVLSIIERGGTPVLWPGLAGWYVGRVESGGGE